jgi:hypothetical protein
MSLWFKKTNHKNKTEKVVVPAPKLALYVGCSPGLIRLQPPSPKEKESGTLI